MKAKRITALILAAVIILAAAAGCSGTTTPEETGGNTGTPSAQEAAAGPAAPEVTGTQETEETDASVPETGPVGTPAGGGTEGEIAWTLYENGTLVISGTGPMEGLWGAEAPDVSSSWDALMENEEFASMWNALMEDEDIDPDMLEQFLGQDWEDALLEEYKEENGTDLENSLWIKQAPWESIYTTPVRAVIVEEGVTTVPEYAFDGYEDLVTAELAGSVESIGECAFWECGKLESVTLPGVRAIGQSAFDECASLVKVDIPAGMTTLDIGAFRNCTALREVSLPEGLNVIGAFAFCNCPALEKISLPASVNRIGREAFYGCSALKDFSVGAGVEVGELAFEYTSLTEGIETLLPESVEDTGASASGMLAGGGKIIPVNEDGVIMYDLYNLLPESRRTLDWEKADVVLLRNVWYEKRTDYVYVGTNTSADGAYNTHSELWLCVPGGDMVRVASSVTNPPESGTPPLRGDKTEGGDMYWQIEGLF